MGLAILARGLGGIRYISEGTRWDSQYQRGGLGGTRNISEVARWDLLY